MQRLLGKWKKLTTGSLNRQIFSAAITVGLMTVLVKLASAAKELVVAWRYGTGDALDAFLIAFLVPSFITSVVAGSFNAALIPTYIRVREQESLETAQKLLSGVTVWSLGLLAIATSLMVMAAPLYLRWIATGFSPDKLNLTFRLLCAIAPIVLLDGMIAIWGAVLNAGERFALAAVSPAITPVITVIFLLVGKSVGIFALAGGLVCGSLLELLLLGAALKRQGMSLRPKWYGFDAHLRQVADQYAPMIAGSFLMSSTVLVGQSMAAMLSPGSLASLNYGSKLITFPMGLATTALGTAVVPFFSTMVVQEDWRGVHFTLKRYLLLIFAISVPLTAGICLFSEPLVQLFFQRGAFTAEDTHLVAHIQTFYALQIPFYIALVFIARLVSAMRLNQVLMWASVLNLLNNIVFNYLFLQKLGIAGIALSTTCVMVSSFILMIFFLQTKLNQLVK
jgi:putative peptidoglycan lipid II flippase